MKLSHTIGAMLNDILAKLSIASGLVLVFMANSFALDSETTNYASQKLDSALNFEFTQAGATSRGLFPEFTTQIELANDTFRPHFLEVVIGIAAINTNDEERDELLRGEDFFHSAEFSQARYVATKFSLQGQNYIAEGQLTIRGITRPLNLPFELKLNKLDKSMRGQMKGEVVINRLDFGIGQGDWTSTTWVGNEVKVIFKLSLKASSS